jgi:hypothetical protein
MTYPNIDIDFNANISKYQEPKNGPDVSHVTHVTLRNLAEPPYIAGEERQITLHKKYPWGRGVSLLKYGVRNVHFCTLDISALQFTLLAEVSASCPLQLVRSPGFTI